MIDQQKPKRCLLITQLKFHSFEDFFEADLRARGYEVDIANDEYPVGFFGKIIGKLQLPPVFSITYNIFTKKYLANNYDIAIIVKGRGVSKRLVEKMKETIPKVIGFNWDSFVVNQSPLKWYKNVNNYYTFDFADADKYGIPCLELFSSLPPYEGEKNIKYDISALGRNYVGRLEYIDRVISTLKPDRLYIFLYENNVFELVLNFVKNPRLYLKYRKYISFKPLSYLDYLDAIRSSEFTVDYAHNQTGITMRCYESLSLRTKLISNNPYLARSNYFNKTNHIISPASGNADDVVTEYQACKRETFTAKKRDITDFMNDLLA